MEGGLKAFGVPNFDTILITWQCTLLSVLKFELLLFSLNKFSVKYYFIKEKKSRNKMIS